MKSTKTSNLVAPQSISAGVANILAASYEVAASNFAALTQPQVSISNEFAQVLQQLSDSSSNASSVFTNIITCLAIKAADGSLDMRVHQVQIGAPFSFRPISEKVVYPFLDAKGFETAKSGWQTRTLERPKPYTMDFDENIGDVKEPFLAAFNFVEVNGESAFEALVYLCYQQMILRESKQIPLATPTIDEIEQIISYFSQHFFAKYRSKGASRLPVLATYAVYEAMMSQLRRYQGKTLRPLQRHSAADAQTGAVGDIEIEESEAGTLFEALEIKHDQQITEGMIEDASKKIAPFQLNRYYLLTTHEHCKPDAAQTRKLQQIKIRLGCQVIVNGVMPTLRYYLRLLENPNVIFQIYAGLLNSEKAISHEHRVMWSEIVTTIE